MIYTRVRAYFLLNTNLEMSLAYTKSGLVSASYIQRTRIWIYSLFPKQIPTIWLSKPSSSTPTHWCSPFRLSAKNKALWLRLPLTSWQREMFPTQVQLEKYTENISDNETTSQFFEEDFHRKSFFFLGSRCLSRCSQTRVIYNTSVISLEYFEYLENWRGRNLIV